MRHDHPLLVLAAACLLALSAVGCADATNADQRRDADDRAPASQRDDSFLGGNGKADSLYSIEEDSPKAEALLEFVNTASFETLDDDVSLDVRAAEHIVDARDTNRISSLRELDGIDWVGSRAFGKLYEYAQSNGIFDGLGSDSVYDIPTGGTKAEVILELANNASLSKLDDDIALDARAAENIVAARADGAISSLHALDDIAWVDARAFGKFHDYAEANDLFAKAGESVHGITPGSDIADAVLDIASTATRWHLDTEVALDARAAGNIADERRDGAIDSLEQLASVSYVADRAFQKLETYAASDASLASAPSGHQWARLLGDGYPDRAAGVAAAPSGAIYLAGTVGRQSFRYPSAANDNAFLAKYNPDGSRAWLRDIGGSNTERARDVAVGTSGDIYVVGSADSALGNATYNGGRQDGFVAKYSPTGEREWTRMIGSSDSDNMYTVATADSAPGIVIAGDSRGDFGGHTNSGLSDVFVSRLDASGSIQWTESIGSDIHDTPHDITLDAAGNIYVAGDIGGAVAGHSFGGGTSDGFLARYDQDGTRDWMRLVGGQGDDSLYGVAAASTGRIAVTGATPTSLDGNSHHGGAHDVLTAAYSPAGDRQWLALHGTSGDDIARDITAGPAGRLFVTGASNGAFGSNQSNQPSATDGILLALDATGATDWTHQFGSPEADSSNAVAHHPASGLTTAGSADASLADQPHGGNLRPDAFLLAWP